MKATPLLFKAEMIQALIREIENPDTGKTMTRRTMKPQPQYIEHPDSAGWYWESPKKIHGFNPVESWEDGASKEWLSEFIGNRYSRYGKPGDLIWCKETARVGSLFANYENQSKSRYSIEYKADGASPMFNGELPGKWFPSKSHNSDGSLRWHPSIFMPRWASRITLLIEDVRVERLQDISERDAKAEGAEAAKCCYAYYHGFCNLWKSINGAESWDSNPWVWVIQFRPILANVDAVIANPEKYGITNANR